MLHDAVTVQFHTHVRTFHVEELTVDLGVGVHKMVGHQFHTAFLDQRQEGTDLFLRFFRTVVHMGVTWGTGHIDHVGVDEVGTSRGCLVVGIGQDIVMEFVRDRFEHMVVLRQFHREPPVADHHDVHVVTFAVFLVEHVKDVGGIDPSVPVLRTDDVLQIQNLARQQIV